MYPFQKCAFKKKGNYFFYKKFYKISFKFNLEKRLGAKIQYYFYKIKNKGGRHKNKNKQNKKSNSQKQ